MTFISGVVDNSTTELGAVSIVPAKETQFSSMNADNPAIRVEARKNNVGGEIICRVF